MAYSEQVSVDALCIVGPRLVLRVHPPVAVRRALAIRASYTHAHEHRHRHKLRTTPYKPSTNQVERLLSTDVTVTNYKCDNTQYTQLMRNF